MVYEAVGKHWHKIILWVVGIACVLLLTMAAAVYGAYSGARPAQPYVVFEGTPVAHGDALVEFATAYQSLGEVCAGQMVTQELGIRIREPAIIKGYIGFRDEDMDQAVPPNTVQFAIPRPVAGSSVDTIRWQVPEYEPGSYARIVGTTTDRPSLPAFFITAFEVIACQ